MIGGGALHDELGAARGRKDDVVTWVVPDTGMPSNSTISNGWGVDPNQICSDKKAWEEAFATRQNSFAPGFILTMGEGENGASAG